MQKFLDFVAAIFNVDPSLLTPQTAYRSIPEWDSAMQLNLVMEIEERYSMEIPIDLVPELKTLEAFYQLISKGAD